MDATISTLVSLSSGKHYKTCETTSKSLEIPCKNIETSNFFFI